MATQIIVILAVQKYVSATLPVCAIITYFVQKIYLRTSRQLRVLEIEAKASLYSTFVETVSNLVFQIPNYLTPGTGRRRAYNQGVRLAKRHRRQSLIRPRCLPPTILFASLPPAVAQLGS